MLDKDLIGKFVTNLVKKGKKEKSFKFFFNLMFKLKKILRQKPLVIISRVVKFSEIYLELVVRNFFMKKKKKKVVSRHIRGRYMLINNERVKRRSVKSILNNFKGNLRKNFFSKLIKEFINIYKFNYYRSLTLKKKFGYFKYLKRARPSSFIKKKKTRRKRINKL